MSDEKALQALLTEDIPLIISHIAGGGKNKSRLGTCNRSGAL